MKEKDRSLFEYNGKTYKLVKQPKESESCKKFCSLYNPGCEKLCVKAYNKLDNPNFSLIEAIFIEVDESENKETGMREIEIDYKKLYEEEHKKYEDALGRAMGHHSVASHYNNADEIQELEHIFPELKEKESEDEKIRKEILEYFSQFENGKLRGVDISHWIAWLEKQNEDTSDIEDDAVRQYMGLSKFTLANMLAERDKANAEIVKAVEELEIQDEQNPTDTPKFKVGDWVSNGYGFVMQIVDVQDGHYVYMYKEEELSATIEQMERSCHLWIIQDAKDGDVLVIESGRRNDECLFIFKDIVCREVLEHCYYRTCDSTFSPTGSFIGYLDNIYHPATKEQRDLLFSKMKEAGYEWDAEKKELKKVKSAWSEEDKVMKGKLREILRLCYDGSNCSICTSDYEKLLTWLELWKGEQKDSYTKQQLRDMGFAFTLNGDIVTPEKTNEAIKEYLAYHKKKWEKEQWKPTDEQMKALKNMLNPDIYYYELLKSLYNDLKKL